MMRFTHKIRTAACWLLLSVLFSSCTALQYAWPRIEYGDLDEGDAAPNPALVDLQGHSSHLLDHQGSRPLVLVFGSFT